MNYNVKTRLVSADGTVKLLLQYSDGQTAETVIMRYKYGICVCLSTQVGCRMGCKFCASEKAGFVRNLSGEEIMSQVHAAESEAGEKVARVVLMGVGEPLDNCEGVRDFVGIITDKNGYKIDPRNISLSTCGIADKLNTASQLHVKLSVSLHFTTDEQRSLYMPVNRRFPLDTLMSALKNYSGRICFEYMVMHGVNDTDGDVSRLTDIVKPLNAHVNLIRQNSIGTDLQDENLSRVKDFQTKLLENGVTTTVRRTLGSDIAAACGQLRINL